VVLEVVMDRLGENKANSVCLLPVSVGESAATAVVEPMPKLASPASALMPAPASSGSIYLEFPKIHLRIESGADAALLRLVLESLPR
jgi:hypothetical protein